MQKTLLMMGLTAVVAAAVVAVATGQTYYGAKKPAKDDGLMSVLKPGQVIRLDTSGSLYELTISNTKIVSKYKVAHIGRDYVVLESKPKLLELRIPVTSIRSIVHLKR